ncbi:carboxypeptidase-like regulatory domain-containing protein [Leptolyngbya sp. 7M]|uniref:carboxypeptidase-like regulatory domain-containing protein n=1 Tax=Leptolyngbya sp. 7M TaxID=2812896 RepID=UPI001B8CAC77|nr:carboxypeptidase-like regulatory domain-containing protein [Leptolyngbya sp. 7M]QYO62966.1 carboxypeptidase-like regulatory domain-containing protein [Leptolyngbya sp. 7M]
MFRKQLVFLSSMLLSFAFIGLLFSAVEAQVTTASMTGRVVDANGNVVAGAKVVVTNRGTGAERTTTTGNDGEFVVTSLPPGRYNVSAEAQSFSRSLIEDVELNVGSRQNVNFTLQPGSIEETVTITTTPPLVETTRSELDTSISPKEIENLPPMQIKLATRLSFVECPLSNLRRQVWSV